MTWMRKSTATMVPRDMRLKKLQLLIDEQSPMRIKPDSLIFLVRPKLREYYVLLNHRQILREWHTARHTFHSEIGARSVLRVVGRSSPHRRVCGEQGRADTLPKIPDRFRVHSNSGREQKVSHVSHSWKTRSGVVISFMCARKGGCEDLTKEILRHFEAYGFLNPVIIQCDKRDECPLDVCRRGAHERNARTVLRFAPKTSHQSKRACRSSTRTHSGTRTMLPDPNRDEHWHTALSSFHLPFHLQFVYAGFCALKIHSAARRQNTIPIFAWKLHMYHLCACFGELVFALIPDHEVRAAKLTTRWISGCWWDEMHRRMNSWWRNEARFA